MPIMPFFARFWPFSVSNDQIPGQGARRGNGRYSVTPPGIIASLRRLHLIYMDSVPLAALWYASGDPDGRQIIRTHGGGKTASLILRQPVHKNKKKKSGTHSVHILGFLAHFSMEKPRQRENPEALISLSFRVLWSIGDSNS